MACAAVAFDVHTLALALFAELSELERACRTLKIRGKLKHEPTGKITAEEIDYCRGDVQATTAALNALKLEFDLHGFDLRPDRRLLTCLNCEILLPENGGCSTQSEV